MKRGWMTILLAAMILSGCGVSQAPRFYALSPLAQPPGTPPVPATGNALIIGLGPVAIPDRLDRPQLLSRTGENEIILAEFDRWSGSLREEVSRTVAENLSHLLPSCRVVSYPWGRRLQLDRQIAIDIIRMEGRLGGELLLKANWAVMTDDGTKTALVRRTEISEKTAGPDYENYVAAQSRALARLSREIAAAIDTLPR